MSAKGFEARSSTFRNGSGPIRGSTAVANHQTSATPPSSPAIPSISRRAPGVSVGPARVAVAPPIINGTLTSRADRDAQLRRAAGSWDAGLLGHSLRPLLRQPRSPIRLSRTLPSRSRAQVVAIRDRGDSGVGRQLRYEGALPLR